jgi:hypothetical protein
MNESMVESANAKLQQRDKRRRVLAARLQRAHTRLLRLQRAHNRLLRLHAKASKDLAGLKLMVEDQGRLYTSIYHAYVSWCLGANVPTPKERADRKRAAGSEVRV